MIAKQGTATAELIKKEPTLFGFLKVGDLVEGKLIKKEGGRKLFLDLGRYGTGVVYGAEILNAKEIIRELKIGDSVHAKVINPDNEEGQIELSLTEATKQKAWNEVMELKEQEAIVKVRIRGINRGGLTAELNGLQAFLPSSQLASEHLTGNETPQNLIDQELSVKIIEVNPRTKKLIVSEREAGQINAKELAKNYQIGQIIEGIVSGVADFGAFVKFTDNPQVEGLIHISELSHQVMENPKEAVRIDQIVKAKITDIKDGKIYLSLKALTEDPWKQATQYYKEGQIIKAEVYNFNPFGAVINLDHNLQGQLHVSEFGSVEEMKKQLQLDKKYEFLIESIKPEERRIILKLKK